MQSFSQKYFSSVVEYRHGYNGMEKDDEVKGEGNSLTTFFRHYDPRLGRWLSLDPKMLKYPHETPYCAFQNNPIFWTDPLGDSPPKYLAHANTLNAPTLSGTGVHAARIEQYERGNGIYYDEGSWYNNSSSYTQVPDMDFVYMKKVDGEIQYYRMYFVPLVTKDENGNLIEDPTLGFYNMLELEENSESGFKNGSSTIRYGDLQGETHTILTRDFDLWEVGFMPSDLTRAGQQFIKELQGKDGADINSAHITSINVTISDQASPEVQAWVKTELQAEADKFGVTINFQIGEIDPSGTSTNTLYTYEIEGTVQTYTEKVDISPLK